MKINILGCMTADELRQSQSLPLELKIIKTQARIREWWNCWRGQVYVSFSGGKDSTVLLHLARSIFPDVPAVFCDTRLEYPEVREFAISRDGVTVIRPERNFKEVVETEGYPVISKRVAQCIHNHRTTKNEEFKNKMLFGYKLPDGRISRRFSIPKKWRYLINAPFNISDKCCEHMKKRPFALYEKKSGNMRMTGELACEGEQRLRTYLRGPGCNNFGGKRPVSKPLSFWTKQDILQYIRDFKLPYSSVYGDIMERDGKLLTTGADRTGCMFCMFGVHLEGPYNRFMRMQSTHPAQWNYCVNELGCGEVLYHVGIPYRCLL